MSKKLNIFIPITKIDEEKRLIFGVATAEQPDKSGEICDYASTVPYYKEWSAEIEKASDGKSKGNLRVMHGNVVAGTIPQINFNDTEKQIEICGKVIDDAEWKKVMAGAYTGFSQGGAYVKTWKDGEFTRYTANPCEISLVDNPCLSTATFEVLKADGGIELRKFQTLEQNKMAKKEMEVNEVKQGWQASDGSFHINKAAATAHNEELAKKAEVADEESDKETEEAGDDEKKAGKAEGASTTEADNKEKDGVTKADGDATPELKKYTGGEVWDVQCAMDALKIIIGLFSSETFEAKFQGENEPGQLADLKMVIDKLKSFIASEIMETEEEGNVMQMSANGDLEKAGAKISKASMEHIKKMHKSASDHMDTMKECMKSLGAMEEEEEGEGEDDKDDKAEKAVQAILAKAQEATKKLEEESNLKLEKFNATVDALQKRIATLEAQPADAKGATKVILKDQENHGAEPAKSTPVEELLKRTDLSPEAMAQEYIKLITKK